MSKKKPNTERQRQKVAKEFLKSLGEVHSVWHRFGNWLTKTYGEDLWGEWQEWDVGGKKIKYRSFNDLELSRRLVGYEVIERVERYVKRWCPEIKVLRCDDAVYAGSTILLIPHPAHGITIMYIPQCTSIQNQFFLYRNHYDELMKALREMKSVYKGAL